MDIEITVWFHCCSQLVDASRWLLCSLIFSTISWINMPSTCLPFFPVSHCNNGFEQPTKACCGYGGPPLNYNSQVVCGQTKTINGSSITTTICNDTTEYVNWDGIHYTEAANQHIASQILTGKFSDPPFADKMPFLLNLKF